MAKNSKPDKGAETCKTFVEGLGFCSFGIGSNVAAVDVKDGRIIRTRPLRYDWKYNREDFNPWKIEARGKSFEPTMKSLLPPFSVAYKKRVHSPNRIMYPMKRVDWDPKGERNPQNRGISGYERITWEEAIQIVADELIRIKEEHGMDAVLSQCDGHGESKVIHAPHGAQTPLLKLLGGYTLLARNPDSWEGWHWGAKHSWGMNPNGLMRPQTNVFPDIAEHTEQILFWGCDPETTPWGWGGQLASKLSYWFTDLGINSIYICPDLNYGAAVHADKWIPILPNTDSAMQLAIAYTWIKEDLYDKEYVATHTVGFEHFEAYVLGKEDGVAKTPKWASDICGVPSRTIKALARHWAEKRTSIAHGNGGGYIRSTYSTEPARLEVCLLAMQGVGKPGRHQFMMIEWGFYHKGVDIPAGHETDPGYPLPGSVETPVVMAAYRGSDPTFTEMPPQIIPKTLLPDAILNPPISWHGSTLFKPTEEQFVKYQYPAEGCSEIKMLWADGPCWITCWNGGNRLIEGLRTDKIETFLVQHPWMENDCLFADLILPSNTKFENDDIGTDTFSGQFGTIFTERKCIEEIGESKSCYEIVCMIAEKLGLLEEYTGGKSVDEWIRFGFEHSGIADQVTFDEFKEKQYYVVPTDPDWKRHKPGLRAFYEDPEANPLQTPSGKIEFYSQRLAEKFPDDLERPPSPRFIPYGESHQESQLHERAKDYPLLVMTNHGRWRVHANLDDISWFKETPTGKVLGPDGYHYEPCWINPEEAEKRGIKNGDIVTVYNERGGVMGGAYVTERLRPGVVYMDHGARYDPVIPGKLDRGGAINTITPGKPNSKNTLGMATSGFLVEVEKTDMEELRVKYPEAFNRPYHSAAGLHIDRVHKGGE